MDMRYTITLLSATFAAAVLAGCHVEKTQEGNVTLPKYEVQQTQKGDVTLPKYDVTPPEVTIGASQAQVTVPKVTTEKETVTVPTIDVKSGAERKADQENQTPPKQ
jgi:hypothetical protein